MDLAESFRFYSENSASTYSRTYRDITRAIADDPDLLSIVSDSPVDASHPGVLLGVVRFLLLDGIDHPLGHLYRRAGAGEEIPSGEIVGEFRSFVEAHRNQILEQMLTRRVQTNEVARASVLAAGLAEVGTRHNEPIALIDVGTSAGLNLTIDRLAIDYGHHRIGPTDSTVQLRCDTLADGPPQRPLPPIGWRVGLDRNPIDVGDPDAVRWLQACIWPEHADRQERLTAAIDLFNTDPPRLVAGDALADLPALMAEAPADHHLAIMTSWVVFYFDTEGRSGFEEVLCQAGRPVSWISAEHPSVVRRLVGKTEPQTDEGDFSALALLDYAGDASHPTREFLAWCHNHGAWIDWQL